MIFGTMKQVKRPVRWGSAKKKGIHFYSRPKSKLQQMEKRLRRGKWWYQGTLDCRNQCFHAMIYSVSLSLVLVLVSVCRLDT